MGRYETKAHGLKGFTFLVQIDRWKQSTQVKVIINELRLSQDSGEWVEIEESVFSHIGKKSSSKSNLQKLIERKEREQQ